MASGTERRFSWRGRPTTARDGETILEALAHDGLPSVVRSPRYHRPRGPLCGVGQCTGCLVRVNGRPNVRACRQVVASGDVVENGNAWPSPRFDLLGVLDTAFPSGIDTLHGFRRPAFLTGLYQRVVRRLSGYSGPPSPEAARALASAPDVRTATTVIVGAGPAGRAAARALVDAGERPLVVDRGLRVPEVPGAELLARSTATFLPPPSADGGWAFSLVGFTEPARGFAIRARRVIVATGGYDAALWFGGADRPGVVTADGALALTPAPGAGPLRRAVVFGGGDRAATTIDRLHESVVAVVAPGEIRPEVVRRASDLGVPLYPRTLLRSVTGRRRVRSVRLESRGGGAPFHVECDSVVLAHRRLPHPQLFFQAGARMRWRGGAGAYFPELTDAGATSVPGLFAAGTVAGVVGDDVATSGERAAKAALGAPFDGPAPRWIPADGPAELEGYYRELLGGPRPGRWVACPCEDVLVAEIEEAHRAGYRGVEVVKRYTGVGTGLCQGRYCLPETLLTLARLEGRTPPEVGYITQRPPVHPTPLAALAALREEFAGEPAP